MKILHVSLRIALLSFLFLTSVSAQQKPDTRWFEEARFGMFVHFGAYSVLGAGEWVMQQRPVMGSDYMKLQDLFNPQEFDAKEWVSIAKNAGMKYINFTSRHHDSFSNWDTKQSDWNIMNTPYGKDIIKQLAEECHRQGIKLMFYYSNLDWMRDDYQWETSGSGKNLGRTEKGNWDAYIDFMKAQLTELLTNYGPIAGIWFDGHWDQTRDMNRTDHSSYVDWHYPEIYELIHSLQPDCLIANNHHVPPFPGEDYQIFERDVPGANSSGHNGQDIATMPLETCETINRTWGFNITDHDYKSVKELVHLLVRSAGSNANLLLNVGPMPNGRIQPECVERLQGVGEWMRRYGHTVYGTRMELGMPREWGAVTSKGKTHYIHILDKDTGTVTLDIPGFRSARWVTSEGAPAWEKEKKSDRITFTFDGRPDDVDSIIEVTVK